MNNSRRKTKGAALFAHCDTTGVRSLCFGTKTKQNKRNKKQTRKKPTLLLSKQERCINMPTCCQDPAKSFQESTPQRRLRSDYSAENSSKATVEKGSNFKQQTNSGLTYGINYQTSVILCVQCIFCK